MIELQRLEGTSDGYMDEVHTLRNTYGADLVAMLATESDSGGLANTMSHPSLSFESSGNFNVNVWDQLGAPSYTLAHEIGHNMGCLHNREDSDGNSSGCTILHLFLLASDGLKMARDMQRSCLMIQNRYPLIPIRFHTFLTQMLLIYQQQQVIRIRKTMHRFLPPLPHMFQISEDPRFRQSYHIFFYLVEEEIQHPSAFV